MRRYEREHPGELIHIDIKKLGRFNRVGHRITGDRRGQSNSRGVGWEMSTSGFHDASRIAYAEIKKSERKASAIAFLKAAVIYYAKLGISIQRVMTDNGSGYKASAFGRACKRRGLKHMRTGPTRRGPTARPSASSKQHSANGPMPKPISAQIIVAQGFRSGCTATIGTVPMAVSAPNRLSANSV